MDVKDITMKSMNKYFKTSYEIFKMQNLERLKKITKQL